ncbi:MAG: hypothetical protein ACFCGT_09870 [Sandaracinaceae bacterium]
MLDVLLDLVVALRPERLGSTLSTDLAASLLEATADVVADPDLVEGLELLRQARLVLPGPQATAVILLHGALRALGASALLRVAPRVAQGPEGPGLAVTAADAASTNRWTTDHGGEPSSSPRLTYRFVSGIMSP